MHLGLKQLRAFFLAHRDDPHLVLATVTGTDGSTYRKAGAMMLLAGDGSHAGLISGGCLEGDLAGHAREVYADGQTRAVSYDLHDDADLVLGLGLGCGGDIHLWLHRFGQADGFGALGALFEAVGERRSALLGLAEPGSGRGAGLLVAGEVYTGTADLEAALRGARSAGSEQPRAWQIDLPGTREAARLLLVRVDPPPQVLICGGGPDARPLAAQVAALGWDCTVSDHRPAVLEDGRWPGSVTTCLARPARLGEALDLGGVDAAVVMTHHLEHDADYLAQLLQTPPAYLGLLGPAQRRRQLERRLDAPVGLIRGPAGLDIGGELPESIALSIMAEIHAVLSRRNPVSVGG